MNTDDLITKKVGETIWIKFDLTKLTEYVEEPVAEVLLLAGKTDSNMSSMVVANSMVVDGGYVDVLVKSGIKNNHYILRCTFKDGTGQVLIEEAKFLVT